MSARRLGCLPKLLIASATAAVALGILVSAGIAFAWRQAAIDTRGEVRFDRPLAVPRLDDGRVDRHGVRVFDLRAQEGTTDLGGERPSRTWGFNGSYLGPTLRAHRGERVAVNVTNALTTTATSVHWHGMHLPARMDGGPHQVVEPGQTWRPTWQVDQPATTLWYHPHPHGQTADHVSRGLAGMFIVGDDEEAALRLPRTYGVDDLPVVVQDKDVRGNGNLGKGSGRTIVVNGTVGPYAAVPTQRVRLRLLNASSMRVMSFQLDNSAGFAVVASDGGLLPRPWHTDHVRLSPGERAEIVLELRPGESRVLQSVRPDLGGNFLSDHFDGGAASFDVLQLRAAPRLRASPPLPATLSTSNLSVAGEEQSVSTVRDFMLNGRQINGRSMDMGRIDFAPPGGHDRALERHQRRRLGTQLPRPRRAVPGAVRRRRSTAGGVVGAQGHAVPRSARAVPPAPALHRPLGPGHPLHGPLSPARARGLGDDGAVRGPRARRAARERQGAGHAAYLLGPLALTGTVAAQVRQVTA